jgi:hypothetical protein
VAGVAKNFRVFPRSAAVLQPDGAVLLASDQRLARGEEMLLPKIFLRYDRQARPFLAGALPGRSEVDDCFFPGHIVLPSWANSFISAGAAMEAFVSAKLFYRLQRYFSSHRHGGAWECLLRNVRFLSFYNNYRIFE